MRSIQPSSFRTTLTGSFCLGIVRPSEVGSTSRGFATSLMRCTSSSTTGPFPLRDRNEKHAHSTAKGRPFGSAPDPHRLRLIHRGQKFHDALLVVRPWVAPPTHPTVANRPTPQRFTPAFIADRDGPAHP